MAEPYGTRLSRLVGTPNLIGLATQTALGRPLGNKLLSAADQAFLEQIVVLGAKVGLGFRRGVPTPVPVKLAGRGGQHGEKMLYLGTGGRGKLRAHAEEGRREEQEGDESSFHGDSTQSNVVFGQKA